MAHRSTLQNLPDAREMAFGVVVAEGNSEIGALLLEGALRTLREAGCAEHNIQVKFVPDLFDLAMTTQFFAEYTTVDGVILLGCNLEGDPQRELLQPILQNILQIQLQWNMPCSWGVVQAKERASAYEQSNRGMEAAISAIRMVKNQIEMEAASPNASPDKRNLN